MMLISNRELPVLKILISGASNKQIAKQLFISESTVITHRKNLLRKLRCKNCIELVYKALKLGYI